MAADAVFHEIADGRNGVLSQPALDGFGRAVRNLMDGANRNFGIVCSDHMVSGEVIDQGEAVAAVQAICDMDQAAIGDW